MRTIKNLDSKNKKIIFLSNAPRPSEKVANFLRKINMDEKFLKNIFTSGEAAIKSLEKNSFGVKFYHLGPDRDSSLFQGMEKNKTTLSECDYILCTGLFDDQKDLNYYEKKFKNNTSKKLICTNPDLTVHKGNREEYCAGKIAEIYSSLGGKVVYFGKPHKEIYDLILVKGQKNLIIGDNLRTDILGANNLKLDCLFITNGVHRSEFNDEKDLYNLLKKYKVITNFFQESLKW